MPGQLATALRSAGTDFTSPPAGGPRGGHRAVLRAKLTDQRRDDLARVSQALVPQRQKDRRALGGRPRREEAAQRGGPGLAVDERHRKGEQAGDQRRLRQDEWS